MFPTDDIATFQATDQNQLLTFSDLVLQTDATYHVTVRAYAGGTLTATKSKSFTVKRPPAIPPARSDRRDRSDIWIGSKAAKQIGDDTYGTGGAGQSLTTEMSGNRAAKFYFTIQNDGNAADSFTIKGTKANRKVAVKYFRRTGGRKTSPAR